MEREPRITVVVTRHFDKTKTAKVEGTIEDVAIPLSAEGMENARIAGKLILPADFNRARVVDSGYVRTQQTNENMFAGIEIGIYNAEKPITLASNYFLGLIQGKGSLTNDDWIRLGEHEALYLELKQNYLSRMAGYAAAGLGEIVDSVKSEMDELVDMEAEQIFSIKEFSEPARMKRLLDEMKKPTSLIHIATHCQPIDAVANVLLGTLEADERGNHILNEYIGNFKRGESFIGAIYGKSDSTNEFEADPMVHFQIRGRNVAHRLSAIEGIRKLHAANALKYQNSINPDLRYNQADLVAVR